MGGGTVPLTPRKETCTFFLSFLLLRSVNLPFLLSFPPAHFYFSLPFFTHYTHSTLNLYNSKLLESVSAAAVLVSFFFFF